MTAPLGRRVERIVRPDGSYEYLPGQATSHADLATRSTATARFREVVSKQGLFATTDTVQEPFWEVRATLRDHRQVAQSAEWLFNTANSSGVYTSSPMGTVSSDRKSRPSKQLGSLYSNEAFDYETRPTRGFWRSPFGASVQSAHNVVAWPSLSSAYWVASGGSSISTTSAVLPPGALAAQRNQATAIRWRGPFVSGDFLRFQYPATAPAYSTFSDRDITIAAYIKADASYAGMSLRFEIEFSATASSAPLAAVTGDEIIPADDKWGRFSSTIRTGTIPSAAKYMRFRLTSLSTINSGITFGVLIAAPQLYCGPERSDLAGANSKSARNASGAGPTITLANTVANGSIGPIVFNRVDIYGAPQAPFRAGLDVPDSGVAAFTVYAKSPGGALTRLGFGSGGLHSVARFPDYSLEVGWSLVIAVEEINASLSDFELDEYLFIAAVDPILEVDLSPCVESVVVESSTSATNTASNPLGNVTSSAVSLSAATAACAYDLSPQSNPDITTNHRIEVAGGIVWRNRFDNGYALSTSGWCVGASPTRSDITAGARGYIPDRARHMIRSATTPGEVSFSTPWQSQRTARCSLEVLNLSTSPTVTVTMDFLRWDGAILATYPASASVEAGEWGKVTASYPAPPRTSTVRLRVANAAPGAVLYGTNAVTVRLDPASGDVIEVVESTPLGEFFTTSWGGPDQDGGVDIAAVDTIGRRSGENRPPEFDSGTIGALVGLNLINHCDVQADAFGVSSSVVESLTGITSDAQVGGYLENLVKSGGCTLVNNGGRYDLISLGDVPEWQDQYTDPVFSSWDSILSTESPRDPGQILNRVVAAGAIYSVDTALSEVGFTGLDAVPAVGTVWDQEAPSPIFLLPGQSVTVFVPMNALPTGSSDADPRSYVVGGVDYSFAANPSNFGSIVGSSTNIWATLIRTVRPISSKAASMKITNTQLYTVRVERIAVRGKPVRAVEVASEVQSPTSQRLYGVKDGTIDVPYVTSRDTLGRIAVTALNQWDGVRVGTTERDRVDVRVFAPGDPFRQLAQQMQIACTRPVIEGQYAVISHRFTVDSEGATSELLARASEVLRPGIYDVDIYDGTSTYR